MKTPVAIYQTIHVSKQESCGIGDGWADKKAPYKALRTIGNGEGRAPTCVADKARAMTGWCQQDDDWGGGVEKTSYRRVVQLAV